MSDVFVRQAAVYQVCATQAQMKIITRWMGCARFVWNELVDATDSIRLINRSSQAVGEERLPYPGASELAGMLPGRGLGLRRKRACNPAAEAEGAANVHQLPIAGNPAVIGAESE